MYKCSSLVESTPHTYSTFTLHHISPPGTPSGDTPPRDCQEVYHRGCTEDGVYTIAPNCPNIKPFKVSCDMKNGKWIVFQRRRHAKLDFNQTWNNYEEGFGDPQYEYWLGLKKLNCLTFSVCAVEMRIDMTDYKGIKKHAIYSSIAVHNADNKYRLDLGAYSGTAGDGMRACLSVTNNDGMPFSTPDRDNDNYSVNCAHSWSGGWWFNSCACSILNAPYNTPYMHQWYTFSRHLKCVEMKLRSKC